MRTHFDFSPLFRSTIGFDHLFDLLESASRNEAADNWPPYDIIKAGDDDYSIVMAVAGFSEEHLDVTLEPNLLVISGSPVRETNGEFLHHGIAGWRFVRRFELADYVKVIGAKLENGF